MQQSNMFLSFLAGVFCTICTTYGEDVSDWDQKTWRWSPLSPSTEGNDQSSLPSKMALLREDSVCAFTQTSPGWLAEQLLQGPLEGTADTSCRYVSLGLTPTISFWNLTGLRHKWSTEQLGQVFVWAKMKHWFVEMYLKPKTEELDSSLGF